VANVPEGITIADAGSIVPRDRIIRHRGGSHSLFANLFRYELQRRGLGTWLDCDVYLLAPLDDDRPYLIGEEEPGRYNGAILRMPPDTPLLPSLLELFDERVVPPWLPWRARMAAHWRHAATGKAGLAKMPWGSAGPLAITAVARRLGIDLGAFPPSVFYPVHWKHADWIFDPNAAAEDLIAPETVAIHLWNERVRARKDAAAPAGSFMARLQAEARA
jgi:hypothetical protein